MKTKILLSDKARSLGGLNRILRGEAYKDCRFFIILDENSYNYCLPQLIGSVSALENAEFFEVPTGEEAKSVDIAIQLWESLLESGADRNSVIVNLGGGCVSDIGGFVAAGFKRGIRYFNVPTTLIGMVDAAIGGKTAVNVGGSKNQVGFFHQPEAVCIYPDFIDTLEPIHKISGIFEMAKTLLLSDAAAFITFSDTIVGNKDLPMDSIKHTIRQRKY